MVRAKDLRPQLGALLHQRDGLVSALGLSMYMPGFGLFPPPLVPVRGRQGAIGSRSCWCSSGLNISSDVSYRENKYIRNRKSKDVASQNRKTSF